MFDAGNVYLDPEVLLAAGYLLICQAVELSVLLLSLLVRCNERAHILRIEAKLLAALIQANAYARVSRNFSPSSASMRGPLRNGSALDDRGYRDQNC